MTNIVVAGIGTGVGKTIVSAILTEAFEADYWKPVQAGDLESSDTIAVRNLISNNKTHFHQETYALKTPMSPHAAAEIDGVKIGIEDLVIPETDNRLIIELAGGIMVPINDYDLNLDLIKQWKL